MPDIHKFFLNKRKSFFDVIGLSITTWFVLLAHYVMVQIKELLLWTTTKLTSS